MPNWTTDDVARIIISVGQQMGISPRGIVIGLATGLVESNLTVYANAKVAGSLDLPHDAVGSDGLSVGVQQQQVVMGDNGQWWWGDVATCQDPTSSTRLFFDRLKTLDYNSPASTPGAYAQRVQQSAFPDRYDQRMDDAQALYDRISGGTVTEPVVDPNRPDFNEYWRESNNSQDRAGTKVDLWLIHTQEGGGGDDAADNLAAFLASTEGGPNPVSYHYTISQASDGGVTVCDVVDTDLASWSVGNSNNRSINLCFAGSFASWTPTQWLAQAKAIDVAAYLCVQDCIKYGIAPNVIKPPYNSDPPGVSDHRYCTQHLQDGNTHTDVGDNFPWEGFAAAVAKYWNLAQGTPAPDPAPPTPAPSNVPAIPKPSTAAKQTAQIWDQLLTRWDMLGGRTLVEAVAELLKAQP